MRGVNSSAHALDAEPAGVDAQSPNARKASAEGPPLREVKTLADEALRALSSVLDGLHSTRGRHSNPPEHLLKAALLMALHSVRSERLLNHEMAEQFFAAVVSLATERGLTSSEHFSADGTRIDARASRKSFQPKGEKPKDRGPPEEPGTRSSTSTARGEATRRTTPRRPPQPG
jgi:transposase